MGGVGGRTYVKRCHTCRKRKIKCDGGEPGCHRCKAQGLPCPGYERALEFVFFDGKTREIEKEQQQAARRHSPPTPKPRVKLPPKEHYDAVPQNSCSEIQKIPSPPTPEFKLETLSSHSLTVVQSKDAFMSILQERYVPDQPIFVTKSGQLICSKWLSTACTLAKTSPPYEMLGDSLLGISLSLVGNEKQHKDLFNTGMKHYAKALIKLRSSLVLGAGRMDQAQLDVSMITCLACAMYEMIANRCITSHIQHLLGVGTLLQMRGVSNLHSPISRRTFYEYRAIQLSICLGTRTSNFLSRPEWIHPPWRDLEPHSQTLLQSIIDIAFHIPVLMERVDRLRDREGRRMGESEKVQRGNSLLFEAVSVQRALGRWRVEHNAGAKSIEHYSTKATNGFESLGIESADEVYPISYQFPHWDTASAFVYLEMTQIFLNNLITDLSECWEETGKPDSITPFMSTVDTIDTTKLAKVSMESADRICKCLKFFLDDKRGFISRMVVLAPFGIARVLFSKLCVIGFGDVDDQVVLGRKAVFCELVAQRGRERGLPT